VSQLIFETCEEIAPEVFKVQAYRVGLFSKKPITYIMHHGTYSGRECFRVPGWIQVEAGEWLKVNAFVKVQKVLLKATKETPCEPQP